MAERLHAHLDGARATNREVGLALGVNPNAFRYAAPKGTVAIRWEGTRAPTIWTVDAADVDPADACRELARRYSTSSGRPRPVGSHAGQGSRGARRPPRSPRWKRRCCRSGRRSAMRGCSQTTSRRCAPRRGPTRPRACSRAAMPTSCGRAEAWTRLPRGARDAVEAKARALPLPGVDRAIEVIWEA